MSDEFEVPAGDGKLDVGPGPFQILALSGGGYRGLYTAHLLEALEKQARQPLAHAFDLIAGTSIGGILAIGLAAGVPAAKLREAFENHGADIFPRAYRIGRVPVFPRLSIPALRRRYSPKGLRKTIEAVLAAAPEAKAVLGELAPQLLIASVDVTNNGPHIFNSCVDNEVALVDAALATSAAPTYFPEHRIGNANFVDGGLIANAPDTVALGHALRLGHPRSTVRMLSIGTVGGSGGEVTRKPRGRGYILGAKALFELTLCAQQKLALEQAESLLAGHYVRLDLNPSADQLAAVGLDRTGRKARGTLENLASQTIEEAERGHAQALRPMLAREASWLSARRKQS